MSIDRRSVRGLMRAIAYDARGSRVGRVAQVFLDDRSDEPAWVAVDVTRTRGMRLLPLAGAGLKGRHLVIRAERATIRSAPRIDLADGQLSSQDEARLIEHYGLASADHTAAAEADGHRPFSPWPDDTARETSWERSAPPTHGTAQTQEIPQDRHRTSEAEPHRSNGTAVPAPGMDAPSGIPSTRSDYDGPPRTDVAPPTPTYHPPNAPAAPAQTPQTADQRWDTPPPPPPPPPPARWSEPAAPPDGSSSGSSPAR